MSSSFFFRQIVLSLFVAKDIPVQLLPLLPLIVECCSYCFALVETANKSDDLPKETYFIIFSFITAEYVYQLEESEKSFHDFGWNIMRRTYKIDWNYSKFIQTFVFW